MFWPLLCVALFRGTPRKTAFYFGCCSSLISLVTRENRNHACLITHASEHKQQVLFCSSMPPTCHTTHSTAAAPCMLFVHCQYQLETWTLPGFHPIPQHRCATHGGNSQRQLMKNWMRGRPPLCASTAKQLVWRCGWGILAVQWSAPGHALHRVA